MGDRDHGKHSAGFLMATERERDRIIERDDLKWLMEHKQGRRVVWRLLEKSGVLQSSYRMDAHSMAFAEGQRNYGLTIWDWVWHEQPDQFLHMMKENAHGNSTDSGNDGNHGSGDRYASDHYHDNPGGTD